MITTAAQWEEFVRRHPDAHLLQTRQWGELKAAFGWEAMHVINGNSGAQLLLRKLVVGTCIAYIPKGPVGLMTSELLEELIEICQRNRAVFLKIEPDLFENEETGSLVAAATWKHVIRTATIQPQRTIVIALDGSENTWLGHMKQKTRYNINLAEKKGVVVKPGNDVAAFYQMMETTGARDGFGIHTLEYYQKAYDLFVANEQCVLLMAYFLGQPLAGLMAFAHGERSWYLYGASSEMERNRMPAYLLQLEAMRWAAGKGCLLYDLWGVPDFDEQTLEKEFAERGDGLWGVYRFKRGFGGELQRSADAYDLVFRPVWYKLYSRIRNRSAL